MMPFKLVCAPNYYLPMGQSVFPVSKYRLICERLLGQGIAGPEDFVAPAPANGITAVGSTGVNARLRPAYMGVL